MEIGDIIASVTGEELRRAHQQRLEVLRARLADAVLDYELERSNPYPDERTRAERLGRHERAIRELAWAVQEVQGRLERSDGALRGGSAQSSARSAEP